ncbi:MAG: VWA domain-containing protein [Planctomycetota bacterium]
MANRPGGELAKRPLQFIWLVDCSGSMQGKKIESVNFAIRECIKPMRDVADENPNAQVFVRAIKFADGAQWHVSQPTDIHDFQWTDLSADGVTDMGLALCEVAKAPDVKNMPDRGLPPVLVLLSDGQPTDDFNTGLKALMDQPWGKKAVRIAIAIGEDADQDVLQKFIGNTEVKPLVANSAPELARMVKWASTVPLKAASNPATRTKDQPDTGHVPIPAPPPDALPTTADDSW